MPEAYVIRALTAPGPGDGADWHQTGSWSGSGIASTRIRPVTYLCNRFLEPKRKA